MTLAVIRQVAAGQLVFPDVVRRWLIGEPAQDSNALTDHEESVLELVIPYGDTRLEPGDMVTALCEIKLANEVREALTKAE